MGLAHSPSVVTDGLVLALDAGNVKSNSEIDIRWNNAIAGATKTSSVGVITCTTIHQSSSSFFGQKYSSCEITGSTVWDNRPPSISDVNEILSGNLTCKSHQTGTYSQVQYLFGGYPNAGDCCTLRFTGFGVGALIGVGGYFGSTRQCKLTGDLRNSPVTITSPSGGFADPIVLTSDPADIKFTSVNAGGSDPWYVYWLGPYNQVPYSIRSNPGYVTGATYSSNDGGALVFDGTDDYVEIPDSSDWDFGTGNFAIELFVKADSVSGTRPLLSVRQAGSGGWGVYFASNVVTFYSDSGSVFNYSTSSNSFSTTGVWRHVVVTRVENTFTTYIDGVSKGTGTSTNSIDNSANDVLTIGKVWPSGMTYFDGSISGVKIYKGKGLTAAEVLQNYNATKGRYA